MKYLAIVRASGRTCCPSPSVGRRAGARQAAVALRLAITRSVREVHKSYRVERHAPARANKPDAARRTYALIHRSSRMGHVWRPRNDSICIDVAREPASRPRDSGWPTRAQGNEPHVHTSGPRLHRRPAVHFQMSFLIWSSRFGESLALRATRLMSACAESAIFTLMLSPNTFRASFLGAGASDRSSSPFR